MTALLPDERLFPKNQNIRMSASAYKLMQPVLIDGKLTTVVLHLCGNFLQLSQKSESHNILFAKKCIAKTFKGRKLPRGILYLSCIDRTNY